MSISGHTHHHEHRFITREDGWQGPEPHHHVVNVTVSGSWWGGRPDERGIPHTLMADGAPNGYSIISFDGQTYEVDFFAAGRPSDYQMAIHAPESVRADQLAATSVWANVFNASERSTVEMRTGSNGDWITMERQVAIDPQYQKVYDAEEAVKQKPWVGLPKPKPSTHLWTARLPEKTAPGTHAIEIRWTDMYGRERTARRIIRVLPPA